VEILDISDPSNPTHVGAITDDATTELDGAFSIYVSGKYAYVASNDDDGVEILDISGIDTPSAHIGDLVVSTLDIWENADIKNNLYVDNGLNVGLGGIYSGGPSSIYATSSATALNIRQSGTGNLVSVFDGSTEAFTILDGGNVGIGTTGPDRKLDILDASNPQMRLTQADGTVYADFQMDSNGDLIMNVDGVSNQLVLDNGGNVGIGTASPRTKLELNDDGAILAVGTYNSGWTEPNLGAGTRLLWYPRKAAFRAGYVSSTQWDDANIGDYSVAMGYDNRASGAYSVVGGGYLNLASYDATYGLTTVGGGQSNTASAGFATVGGGQSNTASGRWSAVGGGIGNTASGYDSTIGGGYYNTASGQYATVSGGRQNTASGLYATVSGGFRNIAAGDYSWAGGGYMQLSASADRTFVWGYSASAVSIDTADAAIFYGVNVGIGTTSPSSLLDVYKTGTLSTDDIVNKISVDDAAASDEYFLTMISDADGTPDTEFKFTTDGTAYADGSWTGSGADYAEYFYTQDTDLQPGEAVCVDVTKDNAVQRCQNSGDNNIMGIVSEKPSVVGNSGEDKENNPNYKIIGMLGQVTGKVTNENGEIKIGDSLTSSSQPGVMRKSNPGESTVGVALENFNNKEGTMRVLISRKNKSLTVEKVEETVAKNIAEMNVQDQVDNLVAEAKKKLDDQILSQKATLDDIQKYINIISGGDLDPADPITLASLRDQINDKDSAVKELQDQMDEIETKYESYDQDIIDALNDFFLAVDGSQFMKFVKMADNINATGLLNGKLKIEEVETDGVKTAQITIINKDEDAPTIGTAVITPVEVDEDEDGIDDKTDSDGKSVIVETGAVSETCKIFTSFENNPGSFSWVEKTFDEESGEYTGFKIMLSQPVSEEVKVDWWIVESR